MSKFEKGQEIWLLQKPNIYRKKVGDCIKRCVYGGKDYHDRNKITFIHNGKLGMGMSVGDEELFETLEKLKEHLIIQKLNEINSLQKQIDKIGDDINHIQSLKDVKEDRERQLNKILNDERNNY